MSLQVIVLHFNRNTFRVSKSTIDAVGTAMAYGLDGPGSIPGIARVFSSPQRPDGFWGLTSLLSNGFFPGI
jgi:hypothetical protein